LSSGVLDLYWGWLRTAWGSKWWEPITCFKGCWITHS
jgi:hypothetical protein